LKGLLLLDDKLGMAHSIENRVPFLDNKLVDFAMSCPADLKIKNFSNNEGKYIFRKMLKRNLPKSIYNNQKQGFSGPDNSWFKNQNMSFVKKKIMNKRNNIFDKTHNSSESEVSDNLISQFDKDFKFHLDRYKYSSRYIKEEKSRHRDACLFILKEIELIHSKDTWFFGKEINKIDICLLPFIRQYRIADIDWFDSLDEIPVIQNWLNYFLESELLKNIMINYKPWEPNDEVEYFPYKPIDS